MSIQLKLLQEANLDQLVDLELHSFSTDRISRRSFRRLLKRSTAAGQGIFEGQKLLGYSLLLFRSNSSKARIYSLAVAANQRGRGVGRTLIAAAVDLARERECSIVQLEVADTNASAIHLYQSLGFELAGRRDAYYQDGSDALVYVRETGVAGC